MAKKVKKEIGNKVHIFRRIFLISSAIALVAAVGVGAFVITTASEVLVLINGALLACAGAVAITSGVAVNAIHNSREIGKNKRKAKKALSKIRELNRDASTSYSTRYRAKILRKYAEANLVLTRRLGGTMYGEFTSTCGVSSEKAARLINEIDAYSILESTATSKRQKAKYSRKIRLLESKLTRITEEEGTQSQRCKWTKSYDSVVTGAHALDRRTEISCLTTVGKTRFQQLFSGDSEITDKKAVNVYLRFSPSSGMAPTVGRAEDQTKGCQIRDILIADLYEACKGKTQVEISSMFPVTVESKVINKHTTKILRNDVMTISCYAQLQEIIAQTERQV